MMRELLLIAVVSALVAIPGGLVPDFFPEQVSLVNSTADSDPAPRSASGSAWAAGRYKKDKRSRKQKTIDRLLHTAQYYLIHEQNSKAAAKELRRVLRLDRGHVSASLGLAGILVDQKKFAKAISTLKKVAKRKPKDLRVWHSLASAYTKKGDLPKAIATHRKALALRSRDSHSLFQVFALTDAQSRQGKASKDDVRTAALAFVRAATNHNSFQYRMVERRMVEISGEPIALTIYDAGQAYRAAFTERRIGAINAKMEEARRGFAKCIKAQPKNQRCRYGLGLVYSSVKASKFYSRKKAQAEFRKADDIAEANFELGRMARQSDDFADARASLKRALKLRPGYAHADLELGVVFKLEGKDDKAVAHFAKAYQADPNSAVAEKAIAELAKIEPDHRLVKRGMLYGGMTGDVFSTDRYRAAVSMVELRYGGVDDSSVDKKVLEQVLTRILEAADFDGSIPITVAVLKTPIVNAMAMPNGNIYFTQGFLDFIRKAWPKRKVDQSNDVLAHVMAHEVAHVLRKHTLGSVLFQQAYKDAAKRLDGAVITHVTRLQEIEADRVGIVLASLAGYHPRGGIEFMEHQGQKEEIPTHLDHPTYEERARYLEDYWTNDVRYAYVSFELGNRSLEAGDKSLLQDPKKSHRHYSKAIDHFGRFRQTLKPTKRVLNNIGIAYAKRGMLVYIGKSSPLERWQSQMSIEKESALKYRSVQREKRPEEAASTRGAAKRSIPRDLTRAIKLFDEALKRDPKYVKALVNKATTQIAIGKLKTAKKTLAKASGRSSELALTRGIVAAEEREYRRAAKLFAAASQVRATRRQAMYNLARTFMLAKEKKSAREVFQRYLRKYPRGPWAAAAKRSLKSL